jgi:MSHA pilin protein MshD
MQPASVRGFTMVELVIFIVVVGIAVAGVLLLMNVNARRSGDAQLRKQALSIAEALLEQVESARFTYCDPQSTNATSTSLTSYTQCTVPEAVGPEAGNTSPYDNVNDYVTSLNVRQSITLQDVNGSAVIAQAGNYVPCITISSAALQNMETDPVANPAMGNTLLIRIEVFSGTGVTCASPGSLPAVVTLEGYRTEYAPLVMP